MIITPRLRAALTTWFIRGAIKATRCADMPQVCVSHMSQMMIAVRATGQRRTCSEAPAPLFAGVPGDSACRALSGGLVSRLAGTAAPPPVAWLRVSIRERIFGQRVSCLVPGFGPVYSRFAFDKVNLTPPMLTRRTLLNSSAAAQLLARRRLAAAETREQRDDRMRWWREARFGMFVHWGLYSGLAGTWDGKPVATSGGMEWLQNRVKADTATYYAEGRHPEVQPTPGLRPRIGAPGQRGGLPLHGAHQQTPRGLRAPRLEGQRLRRRLRPAPRSRSRRSSKPAARA